MAGVPAQIASTAQPASDSGPASAAAHPARSRPRQVVPITIRLTPADNNFADYRPETPAEKPSH